MALGRRLHIPPLLVESHIGALPLSQVSSAVAEKAVMATQPTAPRTPQLRVPTAMLGSPLLRMKFLPFFSVGSVLVTAMSMTATPLGSGGSASSAYSSGPARWS